jgi:anthranilate phosphoribosyltransferase
MLNDQVPELELGALLLAFRIKGESPAEMLGFYRAMQNHMARLRRPAGKAMPVLMPTYNGARRQGNLTPLLALILQRLGVPVLLHGVTADPKRVTTFEVLDALGLPASLTMADAQQRLDAGELAFVPMSVMSPGLHRLLELRWRLGVRGSTHTLAKLADPFAGQSVCLVSVSHPEYLIKMASFFHDANARALLLRGTEGEVYANPKRVPPITYFHDGGEEIVAAAEEGVIAGVPELPEAMDAPTTARWVEQALAGDVPVPRPILMQAACCLYAADAAPDMPAAIATVSTLYPGILQ